MLAAARASGAAATPVAFEVFARALPPGRRYGVVAGTGRLGAAIEAFRFDEADRAHLAAARVVDPGTLEWLASFRFGGDVVGYAEGETYFPGSPVVRVEGTFGEAVLLETLVLSILNHDTAVASAAARMVAAAAPTARLVEMGGRRTHEDAAVDAARAAYVAGFHATSNLEAGRRYGIPTTGTSAHAFTLAHPTEQDAFAAQLRALGPDTTLLVDTYDVDAAIRTAVECARALGRPGPGAVRLDSGELGEQARRARALLDALGATGTRIVVSGDLDEHGIARLERPPRAPVDAYGVGTSVVTGSGQPTAGFVYKLVEAGGRPVEKRSVGKATHGGVKRAWRLLDDDGRVAGEILRLDDHAPPGARPLQHPIVRAGAPVAPVPLADARAHAARARRELPPGALALAPGEASVVPVIEGAP
jgi:nicotinate phosphoribosyltransferase